MTHTLNPVPLVMGAGTEKMWCLLTVGENSMGLHQMLR